MSFNFEKYISILWKKSVKSYLQFKKVYRLREKNILFYSKFLLLWKTTVRMLHNYSGAYNSILNEQVKLIRQISWSRALTLKKNCFICFNESPLKKLVLKFMTPQPPAQQKVTIKIMPNISQNKSNQTMKFGQL